MKKKILTVTFNVDAVVTDNMAPEDIARIISRNLQGSINPERTDPGVVGMTEVKAIETKPVRKARKKKKVSRVDRWTKAATDARSALDEAMAYVEELQSVQEEYSEWRDNLPENLQQSALGEKLDQVVDGVDIQGAIEGIEEAIGVCDEAEAAELPLGFGRD